MLTLLKYNANPKKRNTGDCAIRAVANILDVEWEQALDMLVENSKATGYAPNDTKNIDKVLQKHGYEKKPQPRKIELFTGTYKKVKVRELDKYLTPEQMENGVIVTVSNHCTVVRNNHYEDTWDCGSKTVCNYWVKQ